MPITSIRSADQIDNTAPADNLKTGADKFNRHVHGLDAAELTNQTGGASAAGDVVAVSTANNSAVVLGDTVRSLQRYVVALEAVSSTATGYYARSGVVSGVKATGTIERGHYVMKSATTLTVESAWVSVGASVRPPIGALGIALTTAAAGTVTVLWFPETYTGFDPEKLIEFYEDFAAMDSATGSPTNANVSLTYPWLLHSPNGGITNNFGPQDGHGGWFVFGSTGVTGPYAVPANGSTGLPRQRLVSPSKFPTIAVRVAQPQTPGYCTTAIFSGFGLMDNYSTAAPNNGIYFRLVACTTANGVQRVEAVVRNGGVEAMLNTSQTFIGTCAYEFRMIMLNSTSFAVFAGSTYVGLLESSTAVPSTGLWPTLGSNRIENAGAFAIDYLYVSVPR